MNQSTDSLGKLDEEAAVQALHRKGIQFWIENGILRYRAPRGVVTAAEIDELRRVGALHCRGGDRQGVAQAEPYLLPRPHQTCAPLAFSQLWHWHLRGSADHRPVRQVAAAIRLQGRVDACELKEVFSLIAGRHESLRTRIVVREGEPCQEISRAAVHEYEVVDLTEIAPREQPREIQRQISLAISDVHDYARDALFQVVQLRLGKRDNIIVLAMDHIVSDGASLGIVVGEFWAARARTANSRIHPLPIVRMQFPDYARWQRQVLSTCLSHQASTWNGWGCVQFPEDPCATGQSGWGTVGFHIDAGMKGALEQWARARGTSLVMAVLTAFVALISLWCDISEVSLQFMSDGRRSRMVGNTVGFLAFPFYLRLQLFGCNGFSDLLEVVRQEYYQASERPDYYYSYVQSPRPALVRNSCFNWLPRREKWGEWGSDGSTSLAVSDVTFENPCLESIEWDIEPCVLFRERVTDVFGELMYPRRRFSCQTMKRLASDFGTVLNALVNRPDASFRDSLIT